MAAPSLTYTLVNGQTADASQVQQNFADLLNGYTDGTKDLTINALTCNGAVVFNGHCTLGNGSIDDITISGSLAASIAIKTDGAFDIGSTSAGLRYLYFGDGSGDTGRLGVPTLSADVVYTLPSASGTIATTALVNGALAASISSNILTVSLKGADGNDPSSTNPVDFLFRNATATTGTPVTRSVTGSLSLTVGTTASLGLLTATSNTIYIYALDNAGTVELFASAHPYWDEGRVQSTSTTATSNQVLYGANARSNMAIRLIGRVKATWTNGVGWSSITNLDLTPFDKPKIYAKATSAATSIAASSTNDVINGTLVTDPFNAYNTSTGVFTCPAAGKYLISASNYRSTASSSAANRILYTQVALNGSGNSILPASFTYQVSGTGYGYTVGGSTEIDCAAGDTLKVQAVGDANLNTASFDGNAVNNWVVFERIGP